MKIKKWILWFVSFVATLIFLTVVIIYAWSEVIINRTHDIAVTPVVVPTDSASLKEGERLANILHCSGCHNLDLSGKVFFAVDNVAKVIAPNISDRMPQYSDEELNRLIRHGVKKDGTGTWMPICNQYYHLNDSDLGKLIAFLRTVPVAPSTVSEETSIHLLGRIGILSGQFVQPVVQIDHQAERVKKDTTGIGLGKYYATTVCAACHGPTFAGVPDPVHPTPSLVIAQSYNPEQFSLLMKTGEGLTKKDLGLMSIMSKYHFAHFTDQEIQSIHEFLQTL